LPLKNRIENGPAHKIYDLDLSLHYLSREVVWHQLERRHHVSREALPPILAYTFSTCSPGYFGKVKQNTVHVHEESKAAGYLELQKARVRWFLSTDYDVLPEPAKLASRKPTVPYKLKGRK
jgi:UDP-N-acetyl-2-amino-2-deoxyglucuronate dehydrogenase